VLRYQLDLELSDTIYNRVGHPVAVRAERLTIVCTSWARVLAELARRHAESEVLSVVIRPI
jgi:hypothetical protein